jgi:hypothetical protein
MLYNLLRGLFHETIVLEYAGTSPRICYYSQLAASPSASGLDTLTKDNFLEWLRGFTDAEGMFSTSTGRQN